MSYLSYVTQRFFKRVLKFLSIILLFCIAFFAVLLFFTENLPITLTVEGNHQEQKQDVLQVFWRNQNESFGAGKKRSFDISYGYYKASFALEAVPAFIRIDPIMGAGSAQITRVCLKTVLPVYCISSGERFKAMVIQRYAIDDIQYNAGGVFVRTQQKDPQIEILVPEGVPQRVLALVVIFAVLLSSLLTVGMVKLYSRGFASVRRWTAKKKPVPEHSQLR